jgi:chaperonin cofactor prefoldin
MKKGMTLVVLFLLIGCSTSDIEQLIPYEPPIEENELLDFMYAYSLDKVEIETSLGMSEDTPIQLLMNDSNYIKKVYGDLKVVENEEELKQHLEQQLEKYDSRMGILYKSSSIPASIIEEQYERLMNSHDTISATLLWYTYGIEKTDDGFFIDIYNEFTTNNIELATINKKMDQFFSDLNLQGKSEIERVKMIYEFVIDRMEYVDGGLLKHHSPLGFVLEGEGVCQAYAVSMHMLFERAGIESRYIIGNIHEEFLDEDEFGAHAWNMVKLDGNWYHLDATWDDDETVWSYFLVSDNIMELSRTWETKYYEKATQDYIY